MRLPNRIHPAGSGSPGCAGIFPAVCVCLLASIVGGCSNLAANAAAGMAEDLSSAILDQDDPALVRDGVPTLLLLMDSFVRSSPGDPRTLGAAAELYAAYGTAFTEEPERAKRLTARAREYGQRALCASERGCLRARHENIR